MAFLLTILFLGCAIFFARLLLDALQQGLIKGQGWFGVVRYYCREQQPVYFWLTFYTYCFIVPLCGWILWQMLA